MPEAITRDEERFVEEYIASALGTGVDVGESESRLDCTSDMLDEPSREAMTKDALAFFREHCADIIEGFKLNRDPVAYGAYLFWLTRNRHGAGFWDGDYREPEATRLTEAARRFGERILMLCDDGTIQQVQGP